MSIIKLVLLIVSTIVFVSCSQSDSSVSEIDLIVKQTPLEVKVGQMLMTTVPSTYLSDEFANMIMKYNIGGALLFQPNIIDGDQLVRLTDQIQKKSGSIPMFLALDQEGGRVSRIKDMTFMPSHMALGAANSPQLAKEVGRVIGEELKAYGINTNFAPVLDVLTNQNNSEIATRSFGADPDKVSQMSISFINGLQEAGIIATAKHFPGHGASDLDSHFDLPVINIGKGELMSRDIKPFKSAISEGVDMIMTAHVAYPELDKTEITAYKEDKRLFYPATLSKRILTDVLRKELGFKGVIVTDSMQMRAIIDNFGPQEDAVVKAVSAGADIVIIQTGLEKVYKKIIQSIKDGNLAESRINESFKRIINLKISKGLLRISDGKLIHGEGITKPVDEKLADVNRIVGNKAHKDIQQEAFEKAVTILKNDEGILPIKPELINNTAIFITSDEARSSVEAVIDKLFPHNRKCHSYVYKNIVKLSKEQKDMIDSKDAVILFTYSNGPKSRNPKTYWGASFAKDVADYGDRTNKPVVAVALGDPFDLTYMPGVKAYVCVYGNGARMDIENALKTIFGIIKPEGIMPVEISTQNTQ